MFVDVGAWPTPSPTPPGTGHRHRHRHANRAPLGCTSLPPPGPGLSSTHVCVARMVEGEVRVLSTCSEPGVGARDFDLLIFRHLCAELKAKYGLDVPSDKKASVKLRCAACLVHTHTHKTHTHQAGVRAHQVGLVRQPDEQIRTGCHASHRARAPPPPSSNSRPLLPCARLLHGQGRVGVGAARGLRGVGQASARAHVLTGPARPGRSLLGASHTTPG